MPIDMHEGGLFPANVVKGAHATNPYKPSITPRPNPSGTPASAGKLPGGMSRMATIGREAASIKPPPGSIHNPKVRVPQTLQRTGGGLK